jgi:hypothetical protein
VVGIVASAGFALLNLSAGAAMVTVRRQGRTKKQLGASWSEYWGGGADFHYFP